MIGYIYTQVVNTWLRIERRHARYSVVNADNDNSGRTELSAGVFPRSRPGGQPG